MPKEMDDPDELHDLVNKDDEPIGTLMRQDIPSLEESHRGFTRAVGVLLLNSDGKLWVPIRGEHKKIAPGGLDFSAGEHVGHDESYEAAALRGLQEELHMQPDPSKLFLVGRISPFAGMPYFHEIFGYPSESSPAYNQEDYTGYEWLTPEDTLSRLERGQPAKEILKPGIELLARYLQHKGDRT